VRSQGSSLSQVQCQLLAPGSCPATHPLLVHDSNLVPHHPPPLPVDVGVAVESGHIAGEGFGEGFDGAGGEKVNWPRGIGNG